MLLRRAAQLAGLALRTCEQEAAGAGGSISATLQPSLPTFNAPSSGGSAWLRWRHGLGASSGGSTSRVGTANSGGAAALAAARAAAQQQGQGQAQGLLAVPTWRASSWQQVRRQWTDRRGYQHFGGRQGHPALAVVYSREARTRALTVLGIVGGGGMIIWFSNQQQVPYTERKHTILIRPATELELGRQAFQQVLEEARMNGTLLPPTHRASQSVRRVGTRVAQAATDGYGGGFQDHMKQLQWEFVVIDSPQVNAFVVPGGKVVVYTGLLNLVKSEDELASVLAHESAHVVARHAAERMTQMGALEVGRILMYLLLGLDLPTGPLAAVFFLPNSRKAETEADLIGLQIMARACYNPAAMVTMFDKMGHMEKAEGGDRIPKFLRTHPHSSDRVKAIQGMLPRAEAIYEMSGCEVAHGPLMELRYLLGLE